MTKQALIKKTIVALEQLPQDKVSEVADYTDFILKKYDEQILQRGLEKLVSNSESFDFLKQEEDLYTDKDLKEKYR